MREDLIHSHADKTRAAIIAICTVAAVALIVTLLLPPFQLFDAQDPHMLTVHLLFELFAVVISAQVVSVSFHSLELKENYSANLLIFGFALVAVCDLTHALDYDGMPGFIADSSTPKAIFFWLIGRTVEAATVALIACNVVLRGARWVWLLAAGMAAVLVIWFGTFHVDMFPATFQPGSGVTPFKSGYEYVLATLNSGTALLLWRQASQSRSPRRYLLSGSCAVMAMGGMVLAYYQTPSDFANIFGHVYKVTAYALVYRAAFVLAINEPHRLLQESEQQQRESQQQLRALSDNVPNGMVYQLLVLPDGRRRFLYISAGIERLSNNSLTAQDILHDADKLFSRVVEEDQPVLHAAQQASAARMSVFNVIVRIRREDGELRHLLLCSQPRALADGSTVWDGIVMDVTDRERIEAELRRLNTELEQRVAERTAALSQANRSLESFSYMVAHDLRVPLRHIAGFASMLQQDHAEKLDADGRRLLDSIIERREAMSRLIEGMLAASRMEHTRLNLTTTDLSELATHIAQDLAAVDPQRNVRFKIQSGMIASVDRILMKNVLDNLLGNAWKFTAGRTQATIEFGASDLPDRRVYFVRDNGAGFEPRDADNLFSLFHRLQTHGQFAGHGIGLASVKSIIVSHGGTVWAEGAPGQGATFYFSLPKPV